MLKFYLTTVIIWMIIIQSAFLMFKDVLRKRIYKNEVKKINLVKRFRDLFVLSAVPVFRLIILIFIIYISICKQEDFDKIMKNSST